MKCHNAALKHDGIQADPHGSHHGRLIHERLHGDAQTTRAIAHSCYLMRYHIYSIACHVTVLMLQHLSCIVATTGSLCYDGHLAHEGCHGNALKPCAPGHRLLLTRDSTQSTVPYLHSSHGGELIHEGLHGDVLIDFVTGHTLTAFTRKYSSYSILPA